MENAEYAAPKSNSTCEQNKKHRTLPLPILIPSKLEKHSPSPPFHVSLFLQTEKSASLTFRQHRSMLGKQATIPMNTLITLADSITKLEFYIGGFGGPSYHITLTPDSYQLQSWQADELPQHTPSKLNHTPTRYKRLLRRLFRHYKVKGWKNSYFAPDTMDGTQWELILHRKTPQKALKFNGSNDYPPHFCKLLRLLAPYFRAAGYRFSTSI